MKIKQIITNKLIKIEANQRGIKVSDQDVENYFQRLAKQNNLSIAALKKELKKNNIDFNSYQQEVRYGLLLRAN